MRIASEGWPLILPALVLAAACLAVAWWGGYRPIYYLFWAALAVAVFLLFFFRDPERVPPRDPGLIISPADGRVVIVAEADEPFFLKSRAWQVSIFMSPLDVHVNRSPAPGRVEYKKYYPGKFLPAFKDKASTDNEQVHLGIATDRGRILLKQIAGILARRVVCHPQVGQSVAAGQRLGLIKFGSRVDLFIPISVRISVSRGQRVRAGETIIGRYQP